MTIEYQHLPGKFPTIYLHNTYAEVVISRYGGQVLSYIPKGAQDLFFVSSKAFYEPGKSIKGGVPICWPWFGADPEDKGRGAHGIARNRLWEEWDYREHEDGATTVVLGLMSTVESRALWQHDFRLSLSIKVGKTISLALTTSNTGKHRLFNHAGIAQLFCGKQYCLHADRGVGRLALSRQSRRWQRRNKMARRFSHH